MVVTYLSLLSAFILQVAGSFRYDSSRTLIDLSGGYSALTIADPAQNFFAREDLERVEQNRFA